MPPDGSLMPPAGPWEEGGTNGEVRDNREVIRGSLVIRGGVVIVGRGGGFVILGR